MGYIPSSPQARQEFRSKGLDFDHFVRVAKAAPPSRYELKWMPRPHPAGQGMRGTCVSWAMAYAAKSCLEAQESQSYAGSPERYFSPTFIYSQRLDRGKEGMLLPEAAYLLYAHGCIPWSEMPYLEATADVPPTAEQQRAARIFQIADWAVLSPPTSQRIREALALDMPVVIGVRVTDGFEDLKGDAVFQQFDPAQTKGGHALCVVAYDDARRAIRVINSWGREWADQGYGWISYDLFDKTTDGEGAFCLDAVALVDAPNLLPRVKMDAQGSRGATWTVAITGTAKSLSQVESVDYLMPAGFEPAVVTCRDSGDSASGESFVLHSSDVRAEQNTGPVEVWVQFHLRTTHRATYPRPVLIAAGDGVSPNWINPPRRTDVVEPSRPGPQPPSSNTGVGEKVTVPNVVGLDSGMATLRLMGAGFKVNLQRAGSSASTRAGVTRQEPAAGTAAARGTTVILSLP
jgi:hypothetical protein